jgi:antitoxin component of RelBE/YafQ-DinJ toxin-antitoxin module
MITLLKNKQFRTNDELLIKVQKIAAAEHFDMTTILNSVLEKMVAQNDVPIELIDEKQKRQDKIMQSLYAEIDKGYQDYKDSHVKGIDEAFSTYGIMMF